MNRDRSSWRSCRSRARGLGCGSVAGEMIGVPWVMDSAGRDSCHRDRDGGCEREAGL